VQRRLCVLDPCDTVAFFALFHETAVAWRSVMERQLAEKAKSAKAGGDGSAARGGDGKGGGGGGGTTGAAGAGGGGGVGAAPPSPAARSGGASAIDELFGAIQAGKAAPSGAMAATVHAPGLSGGGGAAAAAAAALAAEYGGVHVAPSLLAALADAGGMGGVTLGSPKGTLYRRRGSSAIGTAGSATATATAAALAAAASASSSAAAAGTAPPPPPRVARPPARFMGTMRLGRASRTGSLMHDISALAAAAAATAAAAAAAAGGGGRASGAIGGDDGVTGVLHEDDEHRDE